MTRPKNFLATARLKPGQMNQTEMAYSLCLEGQRQIGEIMWWKFHAIKLRLADNTYYTPDFLVIDKHGVLECHEVKGFWMEAGRVKLKVASDIYPFRFKAVTKKPKKAGGGWDVEYF